MDSQRISEQLKRDEDFDLFSYLHVLAKHRKMIVKVTAGAFFLSIVLSLCMTKIYTATARILPPQQDNSLMAMMMGSMGGAGGLASLAGGILGGTPSDLYVGILKTEGIKDRIIDRFKLMEVYKEKYRVEAYKTLDRKVDIGAGKKDGIVSIEVDDKDPKRAADMANAFVEELGKVTIRLNMTGAGQNRTFLEQRLAKAKVDLARAEEDLKTFQTKNKAVSVPEQAKASIEGVSLLKAQLAVQEAQLSALRSQFTDSTQEVKNLKATIGNLNSQIVRLEGAGKGAIPSLGSIPDLGQEYVRLMREFKIQETLVELLTKQFEVSKLSEAKDVAGIQVIQEARVPDKKSKPKRAFVVLGLTFLAFCGTVFYSFLLEYFDVMSPDERMKWQHLIDSIDFRRKGTS